MTRGDVTITQDSIRYLPTINAPAAQMSTVNEVLKQTLSIQKSLGLKNIVCVFDQALYAKAVEIAWKHPEEFNSIIIRKSAFHTMCTLLVLRDMCVELGVIAEGSLSSVMEGRKYNRAVQLHKLVYEAFCT